MLKQKRDAMIALLPPSTFIDETRGKEHIDAYWTTANGRFSLVTAKWDSNLNWETRVIITALHTGENVTLRTEDASRVADGLRVLGGIE